jgi:hypothetical protein
MVGHTPVLDFESEFGFRENALIAEKPIERESPNIRTFSGICWYFIDFVV